MCIRDSTHTHTHTHTHIHTHTHTNTHAHAHTHPHTHTNTHTHTHTHTHTQSLLRYRFASVVLSSGVVRLLLKLAVCSCRDRYRIISQKESGVISGQQHFEGGPILWGRELPATCLLSR